MRTTRPAPVRALTAVLAAGLASACVAAPPGDTRTQLEYAAGIGAEEAGLYSSGQLALIKRVNELDTLSEPEKSYRIARIKAGHIPLIRLGL